VIALNHSILTALYATTKFQAKFALFLAFNLIHAKNCIIGLSDAVIRHFLGKPKLDLLLDSATASSFANGSTDVNRIGGDIERVGLQRQFKICGGPLHGGGGCSNQTIVASGVHCLLCGVVLWRMCALAAAAWSRKE
jgi:hypothetical protein